MGVDHRARQQIDQFEISDVPGRSRTVHDCIHDWNDAQTNIDVEAKIHYPTRQLVGEIPGVSSLTFISEIFSVGEDQQVSQERYFRDEWNDQTSDDIIMWLEPPEENPNRRE